jgi:hypothetical protein
MIFGLLALVLSVFFSPALIGSFVRLEGYRPLFTIAEVRVYRALLALSGTAVVLGAALWFAGRNAVWRMRIQKDYAAFAEKTSFDEYVPLGFLRLWLGMTFLVMLGLILTMRWSLTYHSHQSSGWYNLLTRENGIWETLTAVNLAAGGLLFVIAVRKFHDCFDSRITKWPSLILGCLLLFGAGEEISWGQHWLGFSTPDFIRGINTQREFNVHNISSHFTNHLMVFFFLFYVGLLPGLAFLFREVRYVVERFRIPLCHVAFSPFALIGVLMTHHEVVSPLWGRSAWSVAEARETLFGFIMLGTSLSFYLSCRNTSSRHGSEG